MKRRKRKLWTEEDDKRLLEIFARGKSKTTAARTAGARLSRTPMACQKRYSGLTKAQWPEGVTDIPVEAPVCKTRNVHVSPGDTVVIHVV